MREIYFDSNATTQPHADVVCRMTEALGETWGNPSSLHGIGTRARAVVESGREEVALLLGSRPTEIVFTSGATESVNTALRAAVSTDRSAKKRLIYSAIEHECVIEAAAALSKEGVEPVAIPVDSEGRLNLEVLDVELSRGASLCSIMWSNNETGTVLPIPEVGALCRKHGVPFHVDATQAPGKANLDVAQIGCEFLSISAHKFHGPKGVGALFVRRDARFRKLLHGAPHEAGRRAGTENVVGIAGMAVAASRARTGIDERRARMEHLGSRLEDALIRIDGCVVNGRGDGRMPGTVNVSFPGIEGSSVVLTVAREGLCVSAGSACSAAQFGGSHVLEAMGFRYQRLLGAVRYSLCADNTLEEVDLAVEITRRAVAKLRTLNPKG